MTKHIVVVGVGALGSHLIQFLRNEDVIITAVDFDRIEQKNVAAQFFGRGHIGKLKAQATREMSAFLWGNKVITCTSKLTKDNANVLLGAESDLIVDCLDNGESRRVLQNHVRTHRMHCIHGALAADGMFGRVVWDKDFQIDDESNVGEATCDGGEHLPFIVMVSALLAQAIQEWTKRDKHIGFSVSPGGVIKI